jgi:hypothetical protein
MGLRCIIAGSRHATNRALVFRIIDQCPFRDEIAIVVSGKQRTWDEATRQWHGVDYFGEQWAEENGKPVRRYPADWRTYGKKAGPVRNQKMAENADALIAMPMGESRGTRDMIRRAKAQGLRVWVYELEGTDNGRADHQAR